MLFGDARAIAGFLCAVLMLAVVPIAFHDGFFDINRFKVKVVLGAVPPLFVLFLLGIAFRKPAAFDAPVRLPALSMAVLLIACVAACANAGFAPSTLDGSEGRYCGLRFMLCCGAAFFMIGYGIRHTRLLTALMMACSSAVAALGLANAMGMDPLGFYARIPAGQEQVFLSTIGNFDFYGTYLIMLLPVCASCGIFSETTAIRLAGAFCSLVIALGAAASGTDCAALGVHLVFFVLLMLSGECLLHLSRTLLLWAVCTLAQPAAGLLMAKGAIDPEFTGLALLLSSSRLTDAAAILLAFAAMVLALRARRGARAPGRRRMMTAGFSVLAIAAVLLFAVIFWFTAVDTQRDLGALSGFLRFDDSWGSRRGFIFIRALRAYRDYDLKDKLLGRGMEQTLAVLKPYFDRPEMLLDGLYNDPHCQPLQFLLTCGLLGAVAFLAFYAVMLATVWREMGHDPLLMGVFASLIGYLIVMLLNVTQPILIATYFSICALAVGRIRCLAMQRAQRKEGTP